MNCSSSSTQATGSSPSPVLHRGGPQFLHRGKTLPLRLLRPARGLPAAPGLPEAGHRPHRERLCRRFGRGPQAGAALERAHRTLRRSHAFHRPPGRRGARRPGPDHGGRFLGVPVEAVSLCPARRPATAGGSMSSPTTFRVPAAAEGGQRVVLERVGPPPGDQPADPPALAGWRPAHLPLPAGPPGPGRRAGAGPPAAPGQGAAPGVGGSSTPRPALLTRHPLPAVPSVPVATAVAESSTALPGGIPSRVFPGSRVNHPISGSNRRSGRPHLVWNGRSMIKDPRQYFSERRFVRNQEPAQTEESQVRRAGTAHRQD